MIEITDAAATAIAKTCEARAIAPSGGLRIARRDTSEESRASSLVVEFVDEPGPSDTVVREGDAAVFLAHGVERLVGSRTLDAKSDDVPPQFVLRTSSPPA